VRKQKFLDRRGNAGPAIARVTVRAAAGSVRRNVRSIAGRPLHASVTLGKAFFPRIADVRRGEMKVIEERLSSSSEKFQSERQEWPFRMRIRIGPFFRRAYGTRVESPGGIAVESPT
jgi:hypothetical protein